MSNETNEERAKRFDDARFPELYFCVRAWRGTDFKCYIQSGDEVLEEVLHHGEHSQRRHYINPLIGMDPQWQHTRTLTLPLRGYDRGCKPLEDAMREGIALRSEARLFYLSPSEVRDEAVKLLEIRAKRKVTP